MSGGREMEGRDKRREPAGEDAGEDFASRWSRLKRDGRGARPAPEADPQADAPPPADERSDEEILRELGLPDPETLKPGDDIKGFMASAVPARIRNRVLRRLWLSNPMLANLDGLVDYGEDFTDAAMVPAVLQTAYKVGRGWAREAVEEEPEEASAGPERAADGKEPDAAKTDSAQAEAVQADAPETDAAQGAASEARPVTSPERGTDAAAREDRSGRVAAEDTAGPLGAQFGGEAGESSSESGYQAGDATLRVAARRMRFRFADN